LGRNKIGIGLKKYINKSIKMKDDFLNFNEFKQGKPFDIIKQLEALLEDEYDDFNDLLMESVELTPEKEQEIDDAVDRFVEEYDRINMEGTEKELDEFISEGVLGAILGGLTGFALGKALGKAIAKVLGVQKGIFYDMLTSRLVGAALGAALGKRI
jgi:hypothetical protein